VGSDTKTLKQARSLIAEGDYEGAINLIAPIDEPSADETYALAGAYFIHASTLQHKAKSKAAYRKAIRLYPLCYGQCSDPKDACRRWAFGAAMLSDLDELVSARTAAVETTRDVLVVLLEYDFRARAQAKRQDLQSLLDLALSLDPDNPHPLALNFQVYWLIQDRKWRDAYAEQVRAINGLPDRLRGLGLFPAMLVRAGLLAEIAGEDSHMFIDWAEESASDHPAVTSVRDLLGLSSKQERARRARELLSGEARFEGVSFGEWLRGDTVQVGERDEGQEDEPEKRQDGPVKKYTQSRIEQMGPEMRERLIVRLLAEGLGRSQEN